MFKNKYLLWFLLITLLVLLIILNISIGEYNITFINSIKALFSIGEPQDINIVLNVRLPRTIAAIVVGATLSLSGFFMRYTLKNPLADSGILGIQTGATTFALIMILYFPFLYFLIPLVAFLGGLLAFFLTILFTGAKRLNSTSIILSGVIVNAFFTAIIGVLTILNPRKLQSALTYMNGSLVGINMDESIFILILGVVLIILAFLLIPILKILLLEDVAISNLGLNPMKYRFIAMIFSILLASITVSFVGVISFLGIIVPSLAKKLMSLNSLRDELITTIFLGAIIVIASDLLQRVIFAPTEIPVGLLIGLFSAPLFLVILRRNYGV